MDFVTTDHSIFTFSEFGSDTMVLYLLLGHVFRWMLTVLDTWVLALLYRLSVVYYIVVIWYYLFGQAYRNLPSHYLPTSVFRIRMW